MGPSLLLLQAEATTAGFFGRPCSSWILLTAHGQSSVLNRYIQCCILVHYQERSSRMIVEERKFIFYHIFTNEFDGFTRFSFFPTHRARWCICFGQWTLKIENILNGQCNQDWPQLAENFKSRLIFFRWLVVEKKKAIHTFTWSVPDDHTSTAVTARVCPASSGWLISLGGQTWCQRKHRRTLTSYIISTSRHEAQESIQTIGVFKVPQASKGREWSRGFWWERRWEDGQWRMYVLVDSIGMDSEFSI